MLGLGGVTWIDTSVAAVTVSGAASEVTPLTLALMLVDPVPAAEARPLEPDALLIVATVLSDEPQVTTEVRSCVELSVYTPVAVNCCVSPFAMLGLGGVTWIDTSVAAVTVSGAASEVTLLRLALMLVDPVPAAEARPLEPDALLIVATPRLDD